MSVKKQTAATDELVLLKAWTIFKNTTGIRPIHNQADFVHVRNIADTLADIVGDDEMNPLYDLFILVMEMIGEWERVSGVDDALDALMVDEVNLEKLAPIEKIRWYLKARGLRQKDLKNIISETHLSQVLKGKKSLTITMARKLARYFGVKSTTFL